MTGDTGMDAARQECAAYLRNLRLASRRLSHAVKGLDESDILNRFAERIDALIDEAAWEAGIGADPEEQVRVAAPNLDHIGIAVPDLEAATALFVDCLGGKLVAGGTVGDNVMRSTHVQFPGGGKVELLQPFGDHPIRRFLEREGPGMHHLTFVVEDVKGMADRLAQAGHRVVDGDFENPEWREVYVSPRTAFGCLIQLVEPLTDYGDPVDGITLADILDDRWAWVHHHPARKAG
jgi:methylmalonyl-CoA/ethylmalonyl-CoA epimerase